MALVRACDDTLNTDTDALLARISTLEQKLSAIMAGGIAVNAVSSAPAADDGWEAPPIEDELPPPAPMEEAQEAAAPVSGQLVSRPQTLPAVKKDTSAAVVAVEKTEKKKPSGRAVGLRGFADVVKKLEVSDPPLASFMIGATAVERDGKLYINLDSDFAASFLSDDARRATISHTIAEVLGKSYDKGVICPVCSEGGEEEFDAVDELEA
jgi:hypothetical protein